MRGGIWRRLGRADERLEIERELAFHLEMRAREFEAAGLSKEEARRASVASFGDRQEILIQCREERSKGRRERVRREMWRGLAGDWKVAVRSLRRRPGFALAAVSSLGVGIALVTAMATLVDAYLVRSLPYPSAERMVAVEGPGAPDWRSAPDVLEAVAAWDLDALSIVGDGAPERVWNSWVTPGFFDVLGIRPVLGRVFTEAESVPGSEPVAVISHDLWMRRWGGDPAVLGRTFAAYSDDRPDDAEVFTVVGVLPADFWYFNRFTEVLAPLRAPRRVTLARLASGVSAAEAEAVLAGAARERDATRAEVRVRPVRDGFVERVQPVLWALGGAVLLVLLIACGNAAVLLVVRAQGREQEFAIRAAIGASRAIVGRQLIVEGLLLAGLATFAGVVLAAALLGPVRELVPRVLGTGVPGGTAALRIDWLALLAASGCAAIAGLLFGLLPLVVAGRSALMGTLVSGGRGTDTHRRQHVRGVLVAAELALSLSLLIGAGLLVRSARHLQRVELGFDSEHVVALGISLRHRAYPEVEERAAFFDRVTAGLEREVPGVSAAVVGWAPFSRFGGSPVETPEQPALDSTAVTAFVTGASADYFDVLGIRFTRGGTFDASSRAGAPVAIVSESLARRLWPGEDAIGKTVRPATDPMAMDPNAPRRLWHTVVGVVTDVRKTLTEENPPDLYLPFAQNAWFVAEVVVRDPVGRGRLQSMRETVWRVDPEVPLNDVRWLADDVSLASQPSRFLAWLLASFAAFAVGLAVLGLYGVVAFAVSERRREIAIRMALGADAPRVVRLFVKKTAVLVVAGVTAGVLGGLALSRLLASQLHGVSASDPATYVVLALLLGIVTLAATWVPARRAARADPMRVLERT